jgi:hypothetical protein
VVVHRAGLGEGVFGSFAVALFTKYGESDYVLHLKLSLETEAAFTQHT